MIAVAPELDDARLDSPLGRVSPVVKLAIAIGWLIGLALTLRVLPPLILALVALEAGVVLGRIPGRSFARALAPLWIAALGIGVSNTVFAAANSDPRAAELLHIGSVRIAHDAALGGLALACRVIAIASVGAVFTLTTDSTRLADSLVQQAHISPRFAYGALAAYQAIPRFGEDLRTLRQARRVRGLRGGWHPGLLIGVLVLAIRHADRMALAMDARAFGSGPRTFYRPMRWTWHDLALGAGAVVVLVIALAVPA
ncbi:MAG TPA: energy-coupling factor transporter transmembrane component T [Methylomirabilota bacterium]|nr:energy-coupling factor transporter transmembrane component T [Methylomirabilota bacterium]